MNPDSAQGGRGGSAPLKDRRKGKTGCTVSEEAMQPVCATRKQHAPAGRTTGRGRRTDGKTKPSPQISQTKAMAFPVILFPFLTIKQNVIFVKITFCFAYTFLRELLERGGQTKCIREYATCGRTGISCKRISPPT